MRLDGPGNLSLQPEVKPLDRKKALWMAYIGKKRKGDRWPAGLYTGSVSVIAKHVAPGDRKVVDQKFIRLRFD